ASRRRRQTEVRRLGEGGEPSLADGKLRLGAHSVGESLQQAVSEGLQGPRWIRPAEWVVEDLETSSRHDLAGELYLRVRSRRRSEDHRVGTNGRCPECGRAERG